MHTVGGDNFAINSNLLQYHPIHERLKIHIGEKSKQMQPMKLQNSWRDDFALWRTSNFNLPVMMIPKIGFEDYEIGKYHNVFGQYRPNHKP